MANRFWVFLGLIVFVESVAIDPYLQYDILDGYSHEPSYFRHKPIPYTNFGPHNNGYLYKSGYEDEGLTHHNLGFQGLDAYNLKKHNLNDDFANNNFYSGVQGVRKDLGNGQLFNKKDGFEQNGFNTVGNNQLEGHKKGHHRTGFKKSYHKDESGNDESYFDVDHNEGNQAIGKQYGDQFEINSGSSVNGGHKVNEFEDEKHGQEGFIGNGKNFALNQGLRDYYGKNGYYNNGNRFGSLGAQNGFVDYHSPKFGYYNSYY